MLPRPSGGGGGRPKAGRKGRRAAGTGRRTVRPRRARSPGRAVLRRQRNQIGKQRDGYGRTGSVRAGGGAGAGAAAGGAPAARHQGRAVRPSEPGDHGAPHSGPPGADDRGGDLRPVHRGSGRLQAGERHPGPPGGGPGHPPVGPYPLRPVPGQRHRGPPGRGRVRRLPVRPDHRGAGPGAGHRRLPAAAAGPGGRGGGERHRQRGRAPGPAGRELRGPVSGGRPGPVQGEKERQAPLLHQGPQRPAGGGRRPQGGEQHPPHRPAGGDGQRRGPGGDGAGAPGDLCQPQLLPDHRGGARLLRPPQAPDRPDPPGRPVQPGAGPVDGPGERHAGGAHPPGVGERRAGLALVAHPGRQGGVRQPQPGDAGHHHGRVPVQGDGGAAAGADPPPPLRPGPDLQAGVGGGPVHRHVPGVQQGREIPSPGGGSAPLPRRPRRGGLGPPQFRPALPGLRPGAAGGPGQGVRQLCHPQQGYRLLQLGHRVLRDPLRRGGRGRPRRGRAGGASSGRGRRVGRLVPRPLAAAGGAALQPDRADAGQSGPGHGGGAVDRGQRPERPGAGDPLLPDPANGAAEDLQPGGADRLPPLL